MTFGSFLNKNKSETKAKTMITQNDKKQKKSLEVCVVCIYVNKNLPGCTERNVSQR